MVAQKWAHGDIPSALRPPSCQAGCMTRGQEVVNDRCPPPHHCGRLWPVVGTCATNSWNVLKRVETRWVQKWGKYGQLQRLHVQCSLPNPLPIQTVLYQFPYVHRCFTWFHMYPGVSMFFSQTMLPRTRTWRSPAWVAPPPWNSRCGHSTGAPRWQPGVATRWIPNLMDPRIDSSESSSESSSDQESNKNWLFEFWWFWFRTLKLILLGSKLRNFW